MSFPFLFILILNLAVESFAIIKKYLKFFNEIFQRSQTFNSSLRIFIPLFSLFRSDSMQAFFFQFVLFILRVDIYV